MTSQPMKPGACLISDEINKCECSDTDSSSEVEVLTSKEDMKADCSSSNDCEPPRKKQKTEVGESSTNSPIEILEVKEGTAKRDVEIIRVEKRVQ